MKVIRRPALPLTAADVPPLPKNAARRRPRSFTEWRTLRSWQALPPWEESSPGYLLRAAREEAGLTQSDLSERLGCSQQAVAQAERWQSNPTVSFMRRWAEAVGAELSLRIVPESLHLPVGSRQTNMRSRGL